ncbi:hypothetical protein ABK040_006598 [Willaertia magna]
MGSICSVSGSTHCHETSSTISSSYSSKRSKQSSDSYYNKSDNGIILTTDLTLKVEYNNKSNITFPVLVTTVPQNPTLNENKPKEITHPETSIASAQKICPQICSNGIDVLRELAQQEIERKQCNPRNAPLITHLQKYKFP